MFDHFSATEKKSEAGVDIGVKGGTGATKRKVINDFSDISFEICPVAPDLLRVKYLINGLK